MSQYFPLCSYPVWIFLHFLELGNSFFSHIREVFNSHLFKYFLVSFLFCFFFWDSYNSNVGVLLFVPEVFWDSPYYFTFFFFFFLFCSTAETSTILCFRLLIYSSASVFLLLILFSVFFISVIVLFISVCTFFSSPLSLLAIPAQSWYGLYYFFWVFVSSLLALLWILFQADGLYPVHLVGLVDFFSCSFVCMRCLCCLICVCGLLSAGHRIVFLLASGVCLLAGEVDTEQGLPFALQLLSGPWHAPSLLSRGPWICLLPLLLFCGVR